MQKVSNIDKFDWNSRHLRRPWGQQSSDLSKEVRKVAHRPERVTKKRHV